MIHKYPNIAICLLTLVYFAIPSLAQSDPYVRDTRPTRGMMSYSDQIINPIDNIDPVSGKLGLTIPLGSLSYGRDGHGFDVELKYDSHLYDTHPVQVPRVSGEWPCDTEPTATIYSMVGNSLSGGWQYNFKNYRMIEEMRTTFPEPNGVDICSDIQERYWRYRIQLPDGSMHILHLKPASDSYPYGHHNLDGFAGIRADGKNRTPSCPGSSWATRTGLLTYFTTDGSYLKLEITADGTSWEQKDWYLYYPDGRKVVGKKDQVKEIYDANGNKITFSYLQPPISQPTLCSYLNLPCTVIKDETTDPNNQIAIQYNVAQTSTMRRDLVRAAGPNGTISWAIDWDLHGNWGTKYYYAYDGDATCYPNPTTPLLFDESKLLKYVHIPSPTDGSLPALGDDILTGRTYYKFGYSDINSGNDVGSGELDYIRTPLGAEYSYRYRLDGAAIDLAQSYVHDNGIIRRKIEHNDGDSTNNNNSGNPTNPDAMIWTYAYGNESNYSYSLITNPDGGQYKHFHNGPLYYPWGKELVYRIEGPKGSVRKREWAQNKIYAFADFAFFSQNPFIVKETETVGDSWDAPTKTAVKNFSYDKNGNLTSKIEYAWVNYAGSQIETGVSPTRTTTHDYYITMPDALASDPSHVIPANVNGYWRPHNSSIWTNPQSVRRLNAVKRNKIIGGSWTYAATDYHYGHPSTALGPYTNGKVTSERRWDNTKIPSQTQPPAYPGLNSTNSQVLTRSYDSYGNLTDIYEPEVRTHIVYNATGNLVTDVYTAYGSSVQRRWKYSWLNSVALESKTDADNNVKNTFTYDYLGRQTLSKLIDLGTSSSSSDDVNVRSTETSYDDGNRKVTVKSDLKAYGDKLVQSDTKYDNVGRVQLTRKSDGVALDSSSSNGIKVKTIDYYPLDPSDPVNKRLPRRVITSTPYRSTSESTLEWSCTQYDQLGRIVNSAMFKGSTPPTSCANTSNRTGITNIEFDADYIKTTDPAGKARKQGRDALGRLLTVVEDPSGFNYTTSYGYDPLDNLLQVTQGSQIRSFAYSSLSRLKSASNPETNNQATTYTYNDSGDLLTKTDPRGMGISQTTYDPLHRILTKTYTAGTPSVTYDYHVASTSARPNIGYLKSVSSSAGSTTYNNYDVMGNIASSTQTINGLSGNIAMSYQWWLNGSQKQQTYPSGRIVNYDVDNAGRTQWIYRGSRNYADLRYPAVDPDPYAPDGRIARMKLGNNRWATMDYYAPGTPSEYRLGTAQGSGNLLGLQYNYSSTANNGNIQSQTTTRGGTTWQQVFLYDNVNRLTQLTETGGLGINFVRKYGYGNQYGNRFIDPTSTGVAFDTHEAQSSAEFNSANRQTTASANYDAAGNQTYHSPFTLAYDAENRNTSMTSTSSGSGTFHYDADGRRIKKVWTPSGGPTATTYYAYNVLGQMVAEYSSENAAPGTTYAFVDMLGSVRAVTNETGSVVECYDYLPFGRLLNAGENGRNASCFIPSSIKMPQKFTGKERDAETGLDYFGARYYSGAQGRFTTTDPVTITTERLQDPQQLNAYAYVRNNPLRYIDPNGMILTVSGDTEIARGYLCLIAGMDNCSRISITGNVVSFDTKDLDLSANEGAFLIDQLIHSTYVYDFSYGPKVKTAGKSKDVEFVSNIPAFPDQMENYRAKRLPAEIFPADGIDAQIALYYNPKKMAQKSRTKLKPSEPWTAAFHELAEAFSKIDGMSYYYARGHNYDAMRRERALRDQRPYLKEYNYGSGGYVDNPTQDLIIKK